MSFARNFSVVPSVADDDAIVRNANAYGSHAQRLYVGHQRTIRRLPALDVFLIVFAEPG
jgi:hypothetical protein